MEIKGKNVTRKILAISESSTEFGLSKTSRRNYCFGSFHSVFSRTFYKIGCIIGKHPSYFIIIPFFISLLGLSGFQRIQYERDSEYLFVPTDAHTKMARETLEELFPNNSSQLFDPSRISKAKYFAKLYSSAKDGGSMFRWNIWKDVILLDELVQNMTVEWDGKLYNYQDLCARWRGECYHNNIYNLNELIADVEDQKKWISYPIMLFPFTLPMFFGGVQIDEKEGVMEAAKAVFTTYWLKKDDWKQRERAHLWEAELLNMLETTDFDSIIVDRYTSRSIADQLLENNKELKGYLPYALLLLVGFSVVSVLSCDWVRCKITLVLLGILTVVLGICTSFGFLMYCGVSFIGINMAAPFLLLGIGLDNMFVMLSAWKSTKVEDEVATRLANTYSETAVSITVTSLTNVVAFVIGTLTTFPGVRIFCTYLGVSIVFNYLWFLTFFGACLAIMGHLEKQQRHAIFCWRVKSKSEAEKLNWCYKLFCAGGINKTDPWNTIDNKPCWLSSLFKNSLGSLLNQKKMKGFVILLYLVYFCGAIYGCFQTKVGLDPKSLAVDNSYLARFYDTENEYFRTFPYRIQIIIKGELDYFEKEIKTHVMQLHKAMENLTHIGPRLYTKSWIRKFLTYLARKPNLRNNITDERSFIDILNTKFMSSAMKESLDIVYNENKTQIIASRFILQGYKVKDQEEDKDMIRSLREIAENSPLDVSVYHPTFVYYDQYLMVTKTTVRTIAVAAFVTILVSFIFIPNPFSAMWIGASILSIQLGVIGYVSLWGVRLDTVSMVNYILSIGYSVDFSSHIVYAFVKSRQKTQEEKLQESLYTMGLPVVQSGLSTILGVVLFILVPSYIYRTFFKIIFLVTLFGMMHALLVLPVLLSLTSHRFCRLQNTSNTRQNDVEETDPKPRFPTTCPNDILRENKAHITIHQIETSCESSNESREGSLSDSKSVHSDSLRLSVGSTDQPSDPDNTIQMMNSTSIHKETQAEFE